LKTSTDILQQYWGYDSFREKQEDIIDSILKEQDTLALLPTGGGKSICFQVPGLLLEGVCVVISPLIALMHDQVDNLKKRGVKAIAITSDMSKRQIDIAFDNAIYGDTKFLYVSPERLKTKLFLSRFEKMKVNLIAIDEAHCISQWGYDFRPAYIDIAELKKIKTKVPFLALTATATPKVVIDIQDKLKFKSPNVFQKSFVRENVSYITLQTDNKLNRIIEFSKKLNGSGIIYCATRKSTKLLCKHLIENGISANFYHGGLEQEQRKVKQAAWLSNQTKIMVATNAFGMGIDKPDVRFVLHYDIPESLEAYFQEAGRGGRDLKKARAILFFEPKDLHALREKIELKFPSIDTIKSMYNTLGNYFQLAIGSGENEQFDFNISDFANKYNHNLITVYNSLKFLELGGFILLNESSYQPSKLKVLVNNYELYQYQVRSKELNNVIQFILRSHMGIFEDYASINETIISKKLNISILELKKHLNHLHSNEVVDYSPAFKGAKIQYITERLADNNFSINPKFYKNRKDDAFVKLDSVLEFLENKTCRSQYLLGYFGENTSEKCGQCNVCLGIDESTLNNSEYKLIKQAVDETFNEKESFLIEDFIVNQPKFSRQNIIAALRWMSEHDLIYIDKLGKSVSKGIR
jgi:ATP-dependent DNA helicase RecQ